MKPELRCRWEAGSIVTTGGFTTATQHGISGTPVNITENTPETTKRGAPGRSEAKPGRIVLDPGRAHGGAGKPNGFVGIVLGKMGKSGNCFLFFGSFRSWQFDSVRYFRDPKDSRCCEGSKVAKGCKRRQIMIEHEQNACM